MPIHSKALLFAVVLVPGLLIGLGTTPALAQYPPSTSASANPVAATPPPGYVPPMVAYAPAPMIPPRPAAVAPYNTATAPAPATFPAPPPPPAVAAAAAAPAPTGYWGKPAPKKKPNAVVRFFNRIGGWMDGDEEYEGRPVYRDPTTGRTNRVGSEPWLKMLDK